MLQKTARFAIVVIALIGPAACAKGDSAPLGGGGGAGGAGGDDSSGGSSGTHHLSSGPSTGSGAAKPTGATTGGLTGGNQGDCCEASGLPGCVDSVIESCVCATDAYCCNSAWDTSCVSDVSSLGCGSCGIGTSSAVSSSAATSTSSGGGSSCCFSGSGPGCGDPVIEDCVCASDDYCCTGFWDSTCASEVTSLGCGSC